MTKQNKPVPPPELYLGDAVYLTGDAYHLILSTGSHKLSECDNVVYLDHQVQQNLLQYLKSIEKEEK
jgi:hypothetical protein